MQVRSAIPGARASIWIEFDSAGALLCVAVSSGCGCCSNVDDAIAAIPSGTVHSQERVLRVHSNQPSWTRVMKIERLPMCVSL